MKNNDKSKFFHYRNAFKSDHLASADIEELQENNNGVAILTFVKIEYFEGRKVAGKKMDKGLVGFFKEKDIKPMIVNAVNSKTISSFLGSMNVNEWSNINLTVELYVNNKVSLAGNTVSGIRIREILPVIELEEITDFSAAADWLKKEGNTMEKLKTLKKVTEKDEALINEMLLKQEDDGQL